MIFEIFQICALTLVFSVVMKSFASNDTAFFPKFFNFRCIIEMPSGPVDVLYGEVLMDVSASSSVLVVSSVCMLFIVLSSFLLSLGICFGAGPVYNLLKLFAFCCFVILVLLLLVLLLAPRLARRASIAVGPYVCLSVCLQ